MGKIFDAMEKSGSGELPVAIPKQSHQKAAIVAEDGGHFRQGAFSRDADLFPDFVRRTPAVDEQVPARDRDTASPGDLHPSIVTALNPQSVEAEQFRLLKNNILFPEKGRPPKSIMITSPSPDEGKSFVSANLAVSIAQSIDEYVLLMDCDLRGPSVHKLFGMENSTGLSEHLSSSAPLNTLLKKTFIDKLTLLPGGTVPANPSELLSSEQMRSLLNEVKSRYRDRYVIIDTSPPYITSETNAIARVVDGIIIVIRQGQTRKKTVQDIVDIYGREKILGVIKNFATISSLTGYRYKKYGYGNGRG